MVDFHEGTHREKKSRKVHSCDECRQDIGKGEIYIRNSFRINGSYSSMARHISCVHVAGLAKKALMTSEGFPLCLFIGFQRRPGEWERLRGVIRREFKDVYIRLVRSGLPAIVDEPHSRS